MRGVTHACVTYEVRAMRWQRFVALMNKNKNGTGPTAIEPGANRALNCFIQYQNN